MEGRVDLLPGRASTGTAPTWKCQRRPTSFEMYIEYDWGEGGVEIRGYDYSCLMG